MSTCWERADLLALVCGVWLWVCHFPIVILGQVWYLIVSIPDLCTLTYLCCCTRLLRVESLLMALSNLSASSGLSWYGKWKALCCNLKWNKRWYLTQHLALTITIQTLNSLEIGAMMNFWVNMKMDKLLLLCQGHFHVVSAQRKEFSTRYRNLRKGSYLAFILQNLTPSER